MINEWTHKCIYSEIQNSVSIAKINNTLILNFHQTLVTWAVTTISASTGGVAFFPIPVRSILLSRHDCIMASWKLSKNSSLAVAGGSEALPKYWLKLGWLDSLEAIVDDLMVSPDSSITDNLDMPAARSSGLTPPGWAEKGVGAGVDGNPELPPFNKKIVHRLHTFPICMAKCSKNNDRTFKTWLLYSDAGRWKTLGVPVVICGDNLPSPVGIGLTDLPNIGGASGPPGPPPVPASLLFCFDF